MIEDKEGGRPKPIPIEGSDTIIKATTVIGAIGQGAAYEFIGETWLNKLKLNRGRVVTDNHNKTSLPKLFAGGDAVNKTADAISAIADGHRAAIGIDKMFREK
jgi:NADPH-dependent glutamate synthase beta subunit-like oxidoreductase